MVTFLLPPPQELPPQHSHTTLVSPCAFTPPEKLNIKKVSKGSGCLMRTLLLGSFLEKQKNQENHWDVNPMRTLKAINDNWFPGCLHGISHFIA